VRALGGLVPAVAVGSIAIGPLAAASGGQGCLGAATGCTPRAVFARV
jgi:hypothetical protein